MNTKDITKELQELAGTGVEIHALLEGLMSTAYRIGKQVDTRDQQRLDNICNGLNGVMKLLKSELTTKLYDFEYEYSSITGTLQKSEIGA